MLWFRGKCCLHLQGKLIYDATLYLEDLKLHTHRCEILRSQTLREFNFLQWCY